MTALPGTRADESIGENAALKSMPTLPFHARRRRRAIPVVFPCQHEIRLNVVLDDVVERCVRKTATGVRSGFL